MSHALGFTGGVVTQVRRAERAPLLWWIRNLPNRLRGWRAIIGPLFGFGGFYAKLFVTVHRADGTSVNYGLVSLRKVTVAFVNFMVDQPQAELLTWGDFKFHDSGVGVTAEANTDTAIETTDGESRVTGTQVEGATPNIRSPRRLEMTLLLRMPSTGTFASPFSPQILLRSRSHRACLLDISATSSSQGRNHEISSLARSRFILP